MPPARTLGDRLIEALWYMPLIHVILPSFLPVPAVKWPLPKPVRYAGWLVSAAGGALTVWSVLVLVRDGRGLPLPYDPPVQLVTRGPYRSCRNPMEQGNLLLLVGRALIGGDVRFMLASVLFAISHQLYFLQIEEPELRQRFGSHYADYARSTPRWGWRW